MELKPGYKQTEVGVIPEDWDLSCLGEIAEITSSKRIFESDYVPVGIPFFRGKEISLLIDSKPIEDLCFISEAKFNEIKNQFGAPVKGDILITAVGTLGNVFLVSDELPFYFKDGNLIWLRKINNADPIYLAIQLRMAKSTILNGAIGSSQKALTIIVLRDVSIPLPSLPEQRAIATALSDIDNLLTGLEQLIAKKRDIKQAAMQQLLTGERRLPGFNGEWEAKRLGEVVEIVSGGTPKTGISAYWDGGIAWCTPTDITSTDSKYINHTFRTISSLGLMNSSARLLPVGALLLCSRATIGEVKIATGEICTNQGFKSLICGPEVHNEFLYYLLNTMKPQMIEKAIGSTFLEISKKDTFLLEISLPSLEEQTAIADILSDMDVELEALEQKREKTRAMKQGMMQELLTGRVRLV